MPKVSVLPVSRKNRNNKPIARRASVTSLDDVRALMTARRDLDRARDGLESAMLTLRVVMNGDLTPATIITLVDDVSRRLQRTKFSATDLMCLEAARACTNREEPQRARA